jgi:DNA primase
MARIADAEIERLKGEVSLVWLVEGAGVRLEKRGGDYVGCCPFHDDKTPSLVITPAKNLWRCFGACDAGGDVIAWVMKREGVSFRHAVELLRGEPVAPMLAAPAGLRTMAPGVSATPVSETREDAELLGEVVDYYHATLKRTPEALAYLERRGLVHPELVDAFRLGFADRTLGYRLPEKSRKAGAEIRGRLQGVGVLRESGHEHLRGSLVIPITDPHGRVLNLYGRKIRDDLRAGTPDHLYLPGPHRGVFNPAALSSEELILTEALIDALTFWCAGYRHVTSAYGAGGFTEGLLEAIVGAGVKRVLIAFDRDAAGDKGAAGVAEKLSARGIAALRVLFPKGMDANAYALAVRPPTKALGTLLRAAEWMAGPPQGPRPTAQDEPEAGAADPASLSVAEEAPVAPALASVSEDVVIRLGDRTWRARGLARNASLEVLKVGLMVTAGEAFHVDSLDLLSAKARSAYAAEAADELGAPVEAIKRDLGQVLLKIEAAQEQRLEASRQAEARGARGAGPVTLTPTEEVEALAWLRAPDLLARIAADIESIGVVGEAANAQGVYLAALSRKLERPLAVLIQSTSAAGKSALMDAVLDLIPEEERVAYSAMTGQSLFYLGEADLKHKALAIAEEEGVRQAAYALKLLQSQGTLTIASTGKDPATGKLVTQDYTVEGPVALMLTTTAIDLDEELKNRCLVLSIDESREQTRAIHTRQRFEETLEGLRGAEDKAALVRLHRNAQRLIKPLKVVNPYAERLTFLDDKTRTRRDHRKYLALIRAIALLHQHQRPIRQLLRPGAEPVPYIEATISDIAEANRLAHAVLGTTLDELPPQTRRLLGLVRAMVADRAETERIRPGEVRFTRREVREATGWGDTQLKVHLSRLLELEYLIVRRAVDGRHAARFVYELAYGGEGDEGAPFLMGLIDIEALAAEQAANKASYDKNRSAPPEDRSGGGRPLVGPRSGAGRGGEHGGTPLADKGLEEPDALAAENARPRLNGAAVVITASATGGAVAAGA